MSENIPETASKRSRTKRDVLPRISWTTAEVARALGCAPEALRRQCERVATRAEDGEKIARLDLDIVARKRAGRWRFLVPPELSNPTR